MTDGAGPGVALRATAVCAASACLLAATSGAVGVGGLHRVLAALALPPLAALLLAAAIVHRRLLLPAAASTALLAAAAAITAEPYHLAAAAAAVAAAAGLAAACLRGAPAPRGAVRDYVTLTKPRIMSLLLLTGACGMVVGARGWPGARLGAAMVGLACACGGASALNHLLDRDIDRLMGPRTAGRPVASGRIPPSRALEFGLALSACSFTVLASTVNVLTAVLALAGNAFYVLVYTGYLKRRGPANIVLGGAAGAVPPLVGYAAATGDLALPAVWLFLIVFLWTPPHFWTLALLLREHYARAEVPMLPVVRGERATVRRVVAYTTALVAISAVPFAVGAFGAVYLCAALVLGGGFLLLVVGLRAGGRRRAALAFHYSLLYLALLFAAAAVDAAL